ncbi:MAG: hypothetical protein IKA52_03220 [Bacteroidaceae bacterium]|nr:hypothetical protein [Bacteroidaceae bacterium]
MKYQAHLNFVLWKQKKLDGYLKDVVTPYEQSKWKPRDWSSPAGSYATSFDPRKGTFNPEWRSSELERNKYEKNIPIVRKFWNTGSLP